MKNLLHFPCLCSFIQFIHKFMLEIVPIIILYLCCCVLMGALILIQTLFKEIFNLNLLILDEKFYELILLHHISYNSLL